MREPPVLHLWRLVNPAKNRSEHSIEEGDRVLLLSTHQITTKRLLECHHGIVLVVGRCCFNKHDAKPPFLGCFQNRWAGGPEYLASLLASFFLPSKFPSCDDFDYLGADWS